MDTLKSAVSLFRPVNRSDRRGFVIKLGVLVAGATVALAAAAEPATKQGYGPSRPGPRPGAQPRLPQPAVSQPRFSPPAPVAGRTPVYSARVHVTPARAAPLPAYRFRTDDRARLQRYYQGSFRTVRVDRRPHFSAGQSIPRAYRPHIAAMPVQIQRQLPPPPRGYRLGYYQGYSVVYDPVTFTILSVLDLLRR